MMGLIPRPLRKYLTILWQRYRGDITIVPYASLSDYASILSNPSEFFLLRVFGRSSYSTVPCVMSEHVIMWFEGEVKWEGLLR